MPADPFQLVGDARGVGVDPDGYVYVADGSRNTVDKYTNELTYLGSFGGTGTGGGRFRGPVDIDFDRNGNVLVLDQGNDLVQVFGYPFGEGERQQDRDPAKSGC